jgi:hypothetical protein
VRRGDVHEWNALDAARRALHALDLEQPRHDVDVHVQPVERAHDLGDPLVRLARKRDHDAVHVEGVDQRRQLRRGPQVRKRREWVEGRSGRVDEAEDIDVVAARELAGDELSDGAGAHDDRPVERRARPQRGAGEDPGRGDDAGGDGHGQQELTRRVRPDAALRRDDQQQRR